MNSISHLLTLFNDNKRGNVFVDSVIWDGIDKALGDGRVGLEDAL